MQSYRFIWFLILYCSLLNSQMLLADDAASYFGPGKQYSADLVCTKNDGTAITQMIYTDNGKARIEVNYGGIHMVSIIRPDLKKGYVVHATEKKVSEFPYDAERMNMMLPNSLGFGKSEVIGPEVVDGADCTKYKVTTIQNDFCYVWIDTARKIPVKIVTPDGSTTLVKNYKAGPQVAALFEPPADYQIEKLGPPSGHY